MQIQDLLSKAEVVMIQRKRYEALDPTLLLYIESADNADTISCVIEVAEEAAGKYAEVAAYLLKHSIEE